MKRAGMRWGLCGLLIAGAMAQQAFAQSPRATRPVERTARNETRAVQIPEGHPLTPALEMAYRSLDDSRWVRDYRCTFTKCEFVDGRLSAPERVKMAIRNEPFSVYLYCLGPEKPVGQEAIFIAGRNDGKLLAHTTGIAHKIAGMVTIDPTSDRAMEGNRYPVTNAGIHNLLRKLIHFHEQESQYGECDVKIMSGAKINGRSCTVVQVSHPVPRKNFKFHLMRTFYDDELNLPVRWEAYDWPQQAGGKPQLLEEYTYSDLEFNVNLTDADFDPNNPRYGFK